MLSGFWFLPAPDMASPSPSVSSLCVSMRGERENLSTINKDDDDDDDGDDDDVRDDEDNDDAGDEMLITV